MDTQIIRNAYMARPVEQLDMPFGVFAASYLGVKDKELEYIANVSDACNHILMCGYNSEINLNLPRIENV